MITGKELEQKFNIPQQYRSRWDAQFINFISPSKDTPRTYNDYDIMAYSVIVECRKQKMNRPIILAKLAHLAQAGHVKFYPSVTAKTLDDLFNATQQETAMEKAISRSADQPAREKPASRREASRRSAGDQSSIVDQLTRLAEEHGRLAERLRISEESQTDLESRLGWYEEKIALLEERTLKLTLELDNLKKPPLPPAPETPQSKTRGWNVRSILFFFL